ncbi:putative methyltransferase DDB_G0268948 [Chenopodium quinoa]|uniref:Methyltransferase type 11 domain-containing protein n=1 Tax=Chenopodium quinoa TaxID=63459 RepID=A0A803KN98_CHEQI|nr:putative methyltransferase DDB_G0268948 [Chenopodium quinoa]
MAGLFDKQADLYVEGRPDYPKEWYTLLADRTSHHSLAWDVGTGNGQAAISVAEYYNQVIATDISEPQISRAIHHPRVKYIHTPTSLSNNDLISLIGPEGSVDLITVAQAVHWFDLPNFYSIVNRLLKKPRGIFAVWCYNDVTVSPTFDPIMNRFHKTTLPYWDPKIRYVFDGYKTLPFPFEDVGLGSEGRPMELDIPKTMSFEEFLGMLKSWSAVTTAKEKGVDLLNESVVNDLMTAWGGSQLVKPVVYKAFMIAGKLRG